jgi:hypothetical protein
MATPLPRKKSAKAIFSMYALLQIGPRGAALRGYRRLINAISISSHALTA